MKRSIKRRNIKNKSRKRKSRIRSSKSRKLKGGVRPGSQDNITFSDLKSSLTSHDGLRKDYPLISFKIISNTESAKKIFTLGISNFTNPLGNKYGWVHSDNTNIKFVNEKGLTIIVKKNEDDIPVIDFDEIKKTEETVNLTGKYKVFRYNGYCFSGYHCELILKPYN